MKPTDTLVVLGLGPNLALQWAIEALNFLVASAGWFSLDDTNSVGCS